MQIVCARREVSRLAVLTLLVSLTPAAGRANSFTPGNLVIYRVGDGSAGLANTGNPIFLDEYNPTTQMVVNSIELPTAPTGNNQPLIASGTSVSEGLLTRSADGRYILLTGYATMMSASGSLSSSAASMIPRGIGRVDSEGNIDTSTVLSDFADGNNPRSATSTDGMNLWVSGADADSAVRYTTLGGKSSQALSTDSKNGRAVNIFDGQLYVASQKGSIRIATVGTGIPTTAGQKITNLMGFPTSGNPDAFFFADLDPVTPGVDTLYVADDTSNGGEIQKYSLVGSNWIANGSIIAPNVHGLTAIVTGTSVNLFATTSGVDGTSGTLYNFTDNTGYNSPVNGQASMPYSASTNQAYRGITLAPVGGVSPTAVPTATATPTHIAATPTIGSPTATVVPGSCVGDCGDAGAVSVANVITMVNILLGNAQLAMCANGDANHNGIIEVSDVITAVNNLLNGCPRG
jgi:hypothetical protein